MYDCLVFNIILNISNQGGKNSHMHISPSIKKIIA